MSTTVPYDWAAEPTDAELSALDAELSEDTDDEPRWFCPHGVEVNTPGGACHRCAQEDADEAGFVHVVGAGLVSLVVFLLVVAGMADALAHPLALIGALAVPVLVVVAAVAGTLRLVAWAGQRRRSSWSGRW